jgi:hypothetical protein
MADINSKIEKFNLKFPEFKPYFDVLTKKESLEEFQAEKNFILFATEIINSYIQIYSNNYSVEDCKNLSNVLGEILIQTINNK